jgi:hypothetical protein
MKVFWRERESSVQADSKPIWQRKGAGAIVLIFRRIPPKSRVQELEPSSEVLFFCSSLLCFSKNPHNAFLSSFFPQNRLYVAGGMRMRREERGRRKRWAEEREMMSFFSNI